MATKDPLNPSQGGGLTTGWGVSPAISRQSTLNPSQGGGLITVPQPKETEAAGYSAAQANPVSATSTGYTPKGFVVTPDQTVQGQLSKVIADDSPLIQQARTRAAQAANARGLLNSSIAQGAAQAAMVDTALPIAQQDANTYFTANTKSVDAENAASAFGAQASNQASLTNAQLGTDVSKANAGMINEAAARTAQAANERGTATMETGLKRDLAQLDATTRLQLQQMENTTRTELAQMDNDTRLQLGSLDNANRLTIAQLDSTTRERLAMIDQDTRSMLAIIDGQYRTLLQTNQSAQSLFNQVLTDITNISTNTQLAPDAKNAATNTQINFLRESLRAMQGISTTTPDSLADLNLEQYFQSEGAGNPNVPAPGSPGGSSFWGGVENMGEYYGLTSRAFPLANYQAIQNQDLKIAADKYATGKSDAIGAFFAGSRRVFDYMTQAMNGNTTAQRDFELVGVPWWEFTGNVESYQSIFNKPPQWHKFPRPGSSSGEGVQFQ